MLRRLLALVLFLLALPALAHADIYVEQPRVVRRLTLTVSHTSIARSDAPAADAERVRAQAFEALNRAEPRLSRCLERVELREDPLRGPRARFLTGSLSFARAERPSQVRIERANGIPPEAVRCVRESAQSVMVRPAPRGTVVVQFTYQVR